jgi:hypothetical protein
MIYLASPYSDPSRRVREERFKKVCRAAAIILKRDGLVFCPIAHSHPIAEIGRLDLDWEAWERFDRFMIDACGVVYVLTLSGWESSKGIKAETFYAKSLGLPVYYVAFPDLIPQLSPRD